MRSLVSTEVKVGKPAIEPTHPKRVKSRILPGKPGTEVAVEEEAAPVVVVGKTVSPSELVAAVSVRETVSPSELVVKPAAPEEAVPVASVRMTVSPSELVVTTTPVVSTELSVVAVPGATATVGIGVEVLPGASIRATPWRITGISTLPHCCWNVNL